MNEVFLLVVSICDGLWRSLVRFFFSDLLFGSDIEMELLLCDGVITNLLAFNNIYSVI